MFENLSLKSDAFGLDISDFSLKAVKLKKKRKFFDLASWGEIDIKPGIIEEGEIKDEKSLVKSIQDLLGREIKGGKIKNRNVIIGLPEEQAFLKVIQMPIMAKEELKSAVLFEAENHIPHPIGEVYLGFDIVSPIKNSLNHLDIFIVALPKIIVDSYLSCAKAAGLLPMVFEIESQAIARSLIKNERTFKPAVIIDFGKSNANFIIFSGTSIRFTSSIPISSSHITAAISRDLKIDFNEAEKLKLKYGFAIDKDKRNKAQSEIFESIIPILSDLAGQIRKYINYYQDHRSHEHLLIDTEKIEKIILCGRGANLKGLADFLSLSLNIPVEIGNPWVNILSDSSKEVSNLPLKESLGFTTALGLALRGAKEE